MGDHPDGRHFADLCGAVAEQERSCRTNTVDWIPIGGTSARARAVLANQVDATLLTVGEWFRIREQKGVRLLATVSDSVPPLPLNLCVVSTES